MSRRKIGNSLGGIYERENRQTKEKQNAIVSIYEILYRVERAKKGWGGVWGEMRWSVSVRWSVRWSWDEKKREETRRRDETRRTEEKRRDGQQGIIKIYLVSRSRIVRLVWIGVQQIDVVRIFEGALKKRIGSGDRKNTLESCPEGRAKKHSTMAISKATGHEHKKRGVKGLLYLVRDRFIHTGIRRRRSGW